MNPLLSPLSVAVRALFRLYGSNEALARKLTALLLPMALWPLKARRRMNFTNFFGPIPDVELARLERGYLQYYREFIATSLRLRTQTRAELAAMTTIEGADRLREALRGGEGAFLLMTHAGYPGNAVAALAASGYPVTHISNRLPLEEVNALISEVAGCVGAELLWRGSTTPGLVREALGRNRLVVMLYDVVVREKNVEPVPFGRGTIPADLGIPVIAVRHPVPLLRVTHRREEGRWHITVGEPSTLTATGEPRADVRRAMERWMRELEVELARTPEEWWAWSFVHLGGGPAGRA